MYLVNVKSSGILFQIFVAFSECPSFKFALKLRGFHYFTLQTLNEFDPDMILKYFDMISTYYVGEIII